MLTLIGAIAQFERELILEWQREGIARAKALTMPTRTARRRSG
jgi:DNA invertase Pin-like site-specific DNA recombinase